MWFHELSTKSLKFSLQILRKALQAIFKSYANALNACLNKLSAFILKIIISNVESLIKISRSG